MFGFACFKLHKKYTLYSLPRSAFFLQYGGSKIYLCYYEVGINLLFFLPHIYILLSIFFSVDICGLYHCL